MESLIQYISEKTTPRIVDLLRPQCEKYRDKVKKCRQSLIKLVDGYNIAQTNAAKQNPDAKPLHNDDMQILNKVRQGYMLVDEVREFLTGEQTTVNYGFVKRDNGTDYIAYIQFNSLKEFFKSMNSHLRVVTRRTEDTKEVIDRTISNFRVGSINQAAMQRLLNRVHYLQGADGNRIAADTLHDEAGDLRYTAMEKDALTGEMKAVSRKANNGLIYEAHNLQNYLQAKQINIGMQEALQYTAENGASFAQGGDISNVQYKFGENSSINIDSVRNALMDIENMLTNFLNGGEFNTFVEDIADKLTKANVKSKIVEKTKEDILKEIIDSLARNENINFLP